MMVWPCVNFSLSLWSPLVENVIYIQFINAFCILHIQNRESEWLVFGNWKLFVVDDLKKFSLEKKNENNIDEHPSSKYYAISYLLNSLLTLVRIKEIMKFIKFRDYNCRLHSCIFVSNNFCFLDFGCSYL